MTNEQKQYQAPELEAAGLARNVVLGALSVGNDYQNDIMALEMEFGDDSAA